VFVRLLLLFVLVPLLELAILVRLGGYLGFWPTMGLVITTGIVGAALARHQGTRVVKRIRTEIAWGRVPAAPLMDGFLVLAGGLLLLTPGLLTDLVGFALLVPLTRHALKRVLTQRIEKMVRGGTRFTMVVR
jgi:UPF0716 protein FxsA